jgi:hypothetical protein
MQDERKLIVAVALAVLVSGGLGFAVSRQLAAGDQVASPDRRGEPIEMASDEERDREIARLCASQERDAPKLVSQYMGEMRDRSMRVDFLSIAAGAGRVDLVEQLYGDGHGYPVAGLLSNNAPVFLAAAALHVDAVKFLLSVGASVQSRATSLPEPFPAIVMANELTLLQCLLEAGASANQKFLLWDTIEDPQNARFRPDRTIRELRQVGTVDRSELVSPLMLAVIFDRSDAALILLHHGADRLIQSAKGLTALDYAKKLGRRDCEKILIEFGQRSE